MSGPAELLVALVILIGIVGVVVPVLPGALLVAGAIVVWAAVEGGAAWGVLAVALIVLGAAQTGKYLLAHRHLSRAGVPSRSITIGGVLGIVGFFVIPVVGLVIGFIGGVYLSEWHRLQSHREAWPSTVSALKATGLAMLVELAGCCLAAAAWLVGVQAVG